MNKYRFECILKPDRAGHNSITEQKWLSAETYTKALSLTYSDPDVIQTTLLWIDLPDGSQVKPETPTDFDNWGHLEQKLFSQLQPGTWFTMDPFHPYTVQYVKMTLSYAQRLDAGNPASFNPDVLVWVIRS